MNSASKLTPLNICHRRLLIIVTLHVVNYVGNVNNRSGLVKICGGFLNSVGRALVGRLLTTRRNVLVL